LLYYANRKIPLCGQQIYRIRDYLFGAKQMPPPTAASAANAMRMWKRRTTFLRLNLDNYRLDSVTVHTLSASRLSQDRFVQVDQRQALPACDRGLQENHAAMRAHDER